MTSKPPSLPPITALRQKLLAWYDRHGRDLPWRYRSGAPANPYHVWLSEIMLQQTTVVTVIPYFHHFIQNWPSIQSLAQADDTAIMQAWAGLGYYARARNLLACARQITEIHHGEMPSELKALQALPGIGPYTAAAIRTNAFDLPAQPVDGNIERVISRLALIETPMPALKNEVAHYLTDLITPKRPSDMVQAMMDLGAMVCTPKSPKCDICPWASNCGARREKSVDRLPHKAQKTPKPQRHGTVYWFIDQQNRVLLEQRPSRGLLGGMMAFPSQGWDPATDWQPPEKVALAGRVNGSHAAPTKLPSIKHVFTHFTLRLDVHGVCVTPAQKRQLNASLSHPQWVEIAHVDRLALPTLMQKVHRCALNHDLSLLDG